MRVINTTPQRSGTQSFDAFCRHHGLRSVHWCGPEAEARAIGALKGAEPTPDALRRAFAWYYGWGDIFSDFPNPLTWRAWIDADPEAKFVLTTRPVWDWVASVRRHLGGKELTFCEKMFYRNVVGFEGGTIGRYSDGDLAYGYISYCADVRATFADTPERFLQVRLGDADIADRLGSFLGVPVAHPFPHTP